MQIVLEVFAESFIRLLGAVFIATYSLRCLSKQNRRRRPFKLHRIREDLEWVFAQFDGTFFGLVKFVCAFLYALCTAWWSLKRGSLLGYGDVAISLGTFSLVLPTVFDFAILLAKKYLL